MAKLDETDKRYFLMVTPPQDIGYIQGSDISRSCDICGEGKSYGVKHRLHLYIKDSYDSSAIACFNCGYTGNLYSYLKENHPSEYNLYKKEKQGSSFQELKVHQTHQAHQNNKETQEETEQDEPLSEEELNSFNTDFMSSSPVIKPEEPTEPIPKLIDPVKNLVPITEEIKDYIKGRGLTPKENWLYSPKNNKIVFNGKETLLSDYLIVPLEYKGKWYGFQAIGYKQKKFFVYLVQGNDGFKIWNWFNIKKDEPVYIMESIYDAMSSGETNIIGQLGANLHNDRLQQLKEPIFCLDNQHKDEASYRETLKYLELGYKCFIWPKEVPFEIKDFNDLRKKNVPYETISKLINKNIYQGMKGIIYLKTMCR